MADALLVEALRAGDSDAATRLFDRHGKYIERLLYRILGPDEELEDALHDVFAKALTTHSQLRDPSALRAWLSRIAAGTARDLIRRRMRRRWLVFRDPHDVPEVPDHARQEASDLLKRAYRAIDRMKADERIAFTLRRIEVSLATAKRRIRKANEQFQRLAAAEGLAGLSDSTPLEEPNHD
jgi:RNA polymerase sigma-70 factor (ECF subfamily)